MDSQPPTEETAVIYSQVVNDASEQKRSVKPITKPIFLPSSSSSPSTTGNSSFNFSPSEVLTPRSLIVGYLNSSKSSSSNKTFTPHNPKIQEHLVEQNISRIKEGLNSIESKHHTVRKLLDDELRGSEILQKEIGQIREKFEETKDEIQKMDKMLIKEMKEPTTNTTISENLIEQLPLNMDEKLSVDNDLLSTTNNSTTDPTVDKIKEILDEWLEQNLNKQRDSQRRTDGIGFCQIFIWVLLLVLMVMSLLHIFGFSEPLIGKLANWNPTY